MRFTRLALAALFAAPVMAGAQSGTIQATATVVTPLAVNGTANLAFGTVFQGVNKTVAYSDAASGRFSVTGFATSQVALTFTLPSSLSNGVDALAIDSYSAYVNGTNAAAGATSLGAVTSGTPVNSNLVAGSMYLFVGGRVVPTATQAAGSYTGTITLAAAYTGL
jgi:hypothetical protein